MNILTKQNLLFLVALICARVPHVVGFSLDSLENVIDAVLGFGSLIGLWNFLAKSLCVTFTSLVPENFLECVCSGSYQLKKGLGGDLVCRLGNELCLIPAAKSQNALFCGVASIDISFTQIEGFETLEACFEAESGFPVGLPLREELFFVCLEFIPLQFSFLEISTCNVKINDQACTSCSVCQGNRAFSLDCSNINVNPIQGGSFIAGPKMTKCVGLGVWSP